ncbi:Omega-hydroxypalmitate O-feruloyl transferase [Vigna angularis]|uniref:Omega-hydroxypalmitate O-feruloyl transferase n=2 Tax=Phaseolus angularis TaxID=3914 RepID=A0A8T0KLH6_PHAAN|nr:uncharacterized acetyltransferase At3g50280-like [Vigna angularis]KAG2400546.1 Omega-hydroxypalmitate O-feruloyl transferase [Vigna angularis]BAT77861.1 hypothetical protein VIGAN_02046400 [Vigna angularis var. angularis]
MSTPTVRRISECFVKPQSSNKICNLTPWDILSIKKYIHHCLLFKKPATLIDEHHFIQNLLEKLKHSLSLTLFHFYPLSGRLVTHKTQNPPSYTVSIDCNNSDGARFIHATLDMTIADILSPFDVPPIVQSFFDHHKAVNHDGHTVPLLSIQVTELVDGVIIGCSMNHSVGDGTSYWNFFNTWSQIFQAQSQSENHEYDVPISRQPIHNRWFPHNCSPPISLPFKHHDEFIEISERPLLRLRFFHFSAESIAKLKAKANSESNTTKISSFQSLSALVWRSITRARSPPSDQKTTFRFSADCRSRMKPPLAEEYFGNCVHAASAEATTRELLENGIGWAAWKLHVGVTDLNDRVVVEFLEWWLDSPFIGQTGGYFDPYSLLMGGSPRFNMYGCEFGMGKAVAVRSGIANKFDGKVSSYPGREGGGSINLEVCLSPQTMSALESDEEFMNAVTEFDPLLF